jgi:hypothetical protein
MVIEFCYNENAQANDEEEAEMFAERARADPVTSGFPTRTARTTGQISRGRGYVRLGVPFQGELS